MNKQKNEREPYTGEVIEIEKPASNGTAKISPKVQEQHASGFHNRPATRAGKSEERLIDLKTIDRFFS